VEKSSEITKDDALATFNSKSFINGGLFSNILIVVVLSMFVMSAFMMFGSPIWLNAIALMATMYLLIRMRSGNSSYSVFEWGFTQSIKPFLQTRKAFVRSFTWEEVESYKVGIDMDRQHKEYNYLHLDVTKAPKSIRINDQNADMATFLSFRNVFVDQIESYNSSADNTLFKARDGAHPIHHVKAKQDFYKSIWAKLLTIVFVVFSVLAIIYVSKTSDVRATNLYRIFIVVIPGTIYMFYRVFLRKGN